MRTTLGGPLAVRACAPSRVAALAGLLALLCTFAVTGAPGAAAAARGTDGLSAELRAFAIRHRVVSDAPAPGARGAQSAASSSDGGCLRNTQGEPVDASALDISSTELSRCGGAPSLYFMTLQTYDTWDTTRLDASLTTLDTDLNAGTGCDGDDFFAISYYDAELGLVADVLQTPTCDDNSWSYRGEAGVDRADRADFLRMSWDAAQIDSPRDVRYITDIGDGSSFDIAPNSGSYLLSPDTPPPPPKTYPTPMARDITDTCDLQAGTPFVDTIGTTHEYSVNCVSGRRITKGKTLVTFEPEATLTKGQTATFLVNTLKAASYQLPTSERVCLDDDVHADNMSLLIGMGIIPEVDGSTCGAAETIDRELMAMWTRNTAFYGFQARDDGIDWYSDDDTSAYEAQINEITSSGIATGKGGALFGPKESLTRGQMATFLARALDTLLDGG